ncbi:DUF1194 domain-containing protein [Fuscovulum ytuae]|uniref:DUF1194 domain-containing protein n=1 Tax=Fuscovulum ytuae TaxID=3042299 RepID=A0ABY8Q654_9RHOB|nr:DUF1194 domain-containing protein [Fuscovulum sp. YMD61]WGV16061.1 DUF1194 domain-containing protein [Fuscovulum sp. YMD61]
MVFRILGPFLIALTPLVTLKAEATPVDCADIAVVFAIDASGSITSADFRLQTSGHYLALFDPDVLAALSTVGTVDLAAVFWGDSAYSSQVVDWVRVNTAEDAQRFAHRLMATPRMVSGNTDIGTGLTIALDLIERSDRCAHRAVIDLSGNGRATLLGRISRGIPLAFARQRAMDMGVTINALAITTDDGGLADYFRRHVITGHDAFVMEADNPDAYSEALARKLARELLSAADAPKGRSVGG